MRFPAEDVGSARPSDLSREARLACEFSPQILKGRLLSGAPCLSTQPSASVVEAHQWSWNVAFWAPAGLVWVRGSEALVFLVSSGRLCSPGVWGSCHGGRCCRSDVQPHIWSPSYFHLKPDSDCLSKQTVNSTVQSS